MTLFILTGALLIKNMVGEPTVYLYQPVIYQTSEQCHKALADNKKKDPENYSGKCSEVSL